MQLGCTFQIVNMTFIFRFTNVVFLHTDYEIDGLTSRPDCLNLRHIVWSWDTLYLAPTTSKPIIRFVHHLWTRTSVPVNNCHLSSPLSRIWCKNSCTYGSPLELSVWPSYTMWGFCIYIYQFVADVARHCGTDHSLDWHIHCCRLQGCPASSQDVVGSPHLTQHAMCL